MKKSFTNQNPALAFITPQEGEQPAQAAQAVPVKRSYSKIVQESRVNYLGEEARTERISCLIRPTTLKQLRKVATVKRVSVNGLINQALEELIEREAASLASYDAQHGEDE